MNLIDIAIREFEAHSIRKLERHVGPNDCSQASTARA